MSSVFPIRSSRPSQSSVARWLAASAASLLIHASAAAAAIATAWWGLAEWDEARFEGRSRVIEVQAAWSVENEATEVDVEVPEAPSTVEVSPEAVRIETQRFTESPPLEVEVPQSQLPEVRRSESPHREVDPARIAWERMETPDVQRDVSMMTPSSGTVSPHIPQQEPSSATQAMPRATRQPPSVASANVSAELPGEDADERPQFVNNRPPRYPDLARQRGWQGTVLLRLVIDATGAVVDVRVAESSGHDLLDGEAVNAVRSWKARPARRAGQPVPSVEWLPVRFVMDGTSSR